MCLKLGEIGKVKSEEEKTPFLPSLPSTFGAVGNPAFSSCSALQVGSCSGSLTVFMLLYWGGGRSGGHPPGWSPVLLVKLTTFPEHQIFLCGGESGLVWTLARSSWPPGLFPWALKSVPMRWSQLLLEFMVRVWVSSRPLPLGTLTVRTPGDKWPSERLVATGWRILCL